MVISLVVFALGALVGILLAGVTAWADLESTLFNASIGAKTKLKTLRCPAILVADEVSTVSATFDNPADVDKALIVHTRISDGFVTLLQQNDEMVYLTPGETQTLTWDVSASNAAWNRFVFVRVYVGRNYPLPERTGTCGIFVVQLPFLTGRQVVIAALLIGGLLMAAGIVLYARVGRSGINPGFISLSALLIIAVLVAVMVVLALIGDWLFSGFVLLVLLIMIMSIVGTAILRH